MRLARVLVVGVASLALVGCGEKDPNKNLKPVPADAPKPTAAGAMGAGGAKSAPTPAVKAPAPID